MTCTEEYKEHIVCTPVNPLLRITFEKVNPGAIPLLIFSVCIIIYGVRENGMIPPCADIMAYLFLVFLMTILFYDMELMIRCFAFFVFSVNNDCFFGVAIVCIFTFIALSFWTYGVHRYESTSS